MFLSLTVILPDGSGQILLAAVDDEHCEQREPRRG